MRIVEDYPRVIRTCTVQQRILTDPLDTKHGVDLLDAQMSASLFRGPLFDWFSTETEGKATTMFEPPKKTDNPVAILV